MHVPCLLRADLAAILGKVGVGCLGCWAVVSRRAPVQGRMECDGCRFVKGPAIAHHVHMTTYFGIILDLCTYNQVIELISEVIKVCFQ